MTSLTFKVISAGAKIRQYGSIQANFIAVTELLNVNNIPLFSIILALHR